MPVSKPTTLPQWDSNGIALTTPDTSHKNNGFATNDQFPSQWANWLFYWLYQWCTWLNDITNQALTWTAAHIFQANVSITGPSGDAVPALSVPSVTGTKDGASFHGGSAGGTAITAISHASGDIAATINGLNGAQAMVASGTNAGPAVRLHNANGAGVPVWLSRGSSTNTNADVATADGYIDLSGGPQPAANDSVPTNRLTKANVCRAWGVIRQGGSQRACLDGFNIGSVAAGTYSYSLRINFVQAMANANYSVSALWNNQAYFCYSFNKNTAGFEIGVVDLSNIPGGSETTPVDLTANPGDPTYLLQVSVFGKQ